MEVLTERSDFVKNLGNSNSPELKLLNKKLESTTNVKIENVNGEQKFVSKQAGGKLDSQDLTEGVVAVSSKHFYAPPENKEQHQANANKANFNAHVVNISQNTVPELDWTAQYNLALSQNREALYMANPDLTNEKIPVKERVELFAKTAPTHPELKNLAKLEQGSRDLEAQQKAIQSPPPLFSLHDPNPDEMAKLFADKKSYYGDIQDFTQNRRAYFKALAQYDAKTRFVLYQRAGLDEHTITQYEYGVRSVAGDAYDRDIEKAYGAEQAAKMQSDLNKLTMTNHEPSQLQINWRSANKEDKALEQGVPVDLKATEEAKPEKKNNFATLTPSAVGEKHTRAAEEEEKVNKQYLTEKERLALEEEEKLKQKEELQQHRTLTV